MNTTLSAKLRSLGRRLLREESGQSVVEYVLVLAIVVLLATKVRSVIASKVGNLVDDTGGRLEQFGEE